MAEKLKRTYDLLVLKVELHDRPAPGEEVLFTLQRSESGELFFERSWDAGLEEIGIPRGSDGPRAVSARGTELPLSLPEHLLADLEDWVRDHGEWTRPLWVHLVRPYGSLGLVPWEVLLGNRLLIPILMLPDFIFPPPRETEGVLDVVLCASAPLGVEEIYVYMAMTEALHSITAVLKRHMRIHLFADWEMARLLSQHAAAVERPGVQVLVYDHPQAVSGGEEESSSRLVARPGAIRSPWLLWMVEALRGRSVDVVHFVCHGHLSREGGSLLFAESPLGGSERYLSAPVGATELQTFLTRVGAWSSVFTGPKDNHSPAGLRALADEIAQNRPGPMMMHTAAREESRLTVGAGYRFLYGEEPVPVPRSRSLFIYCQPYLVTRRSRVGRRLETRGDTLLAQTGVLRNEAQWTVLFSALEASPIDGVFEDVDQVQPWVASTERFADQVQMELQELVREDVLPAGHRELHTRVKQQMLSALRQAVAEEARSSFLVSEGEG